jgi:two-component system, cell cycle sensor histidine kinase and response regulator CckA
MEKISQENIPDSTLNENAPTVLVVEDDVGLNRLTCKILEREGIKTHHALNGNDAISAARTLRDGIILLDYCLPDMNGQQMIIALREEKIGTPVIVMTGHGDERTAVEIMKLGARDYIIKEPDFITRVPRIIRRTFDAIAKEKELARSEVVLRESEEKFRKVFFTCPDLISINRLADGMFISVNKGFEQLSGYSEKDVAGKTSLELKMWKNPDDRKKVVESLRANGRIENYETQYITKNGNIVDGLMSAAIIEIDGISHILNISRDITERKQAEDKLQKSEAKYRELYENMLDAFVMVDMAGRIIEFNQAYVNLVGYSAEEIRTLTYIDLIPEKWHAAEKKIVENQIIKRGYSDVYEKEYRRKDGTLVSIELRTILLRDASEDPIGMWGIIRDITERKRAGEKQKKLEEQLRQSQKLEAIGQLSSGVAHDFNNLLGGIMGHAELLKMHLSEGSDLLRHTASIISSCTKAADLTKQLLTFARKAPVELVKVDPNAIIKHIMGIMERTIDRRIEIIVNLQEHPPFISGDRNQLENALLNIAINARDAMPEGGRLTIISEAVDLNKTSLSDEHFEVKEGPYVKISIADTGFGMSKETQGRIFEPFFTTKEVGKGTGLGLASVYGCVKQHNGYITVESREGKGAQFNVYLPVIKSTRPMAGVTEESTLIPGKGTLLVVDDERAYHEILKEIFGGLGYTVHCCADGVEAVTFYREHNSAIHVVILDLNMPKMNGLDCFRRLKEINANVKVIVSSGYGENTDRAAMQTEGVSAFVQKPYRAADLAEKIKELMGA